MGYSKNTNKSADNGGMAATGGAPSAQWSSRVRPVAIAAIVVILAAVAFLAVRWRTGNVERGMEEKAQKIPIARDKAPKVHQATAKPPASPKVEVPKPVDPNARPTKVGEELNGYVMLPNGKMHRRRGVRTVEPGGVDRSHPSAIFDHSTDNEFAVILTLKPGETLIGGPLRHSGNYRESFLESLKTPIIVNKDDPEDVQALKRAVIETRLQMKDALDRGEDIGKIVEESYVEAQKLSLYKDTLREQINEAFRNEDMTDQELDELIAAANRMLEDKGIAPMKFGALTRARLRNLRK